MSIISSFVNMNHSVSVSILIMARAIRVILEQHSLVWYLNIQVRIISMPWRKERDRPVARRMIYAEQYCLRENVLRFVEEIKVHNNFN